MQKYQGAIVTMTATPDFEEMWRTYSLPTWQAYADKHRLEIIQLKHFIDRSERGTTRHPSWQKLLIGQEPIVRRYRKVLWLDADVVMTYNAENEVPFVFDTVEPGRLAMVRGQWFFLTPIAKRGFHRCCGVFKSLHDYNASLYKTNDFPLDGQYPQGFVMNNAGVIAFNSPDWNKLKELYETREPGIKSFGEQVHLSQWLARCEHPWVYLNPLFNVEWYTLKYSVYEYAIDSKHTLAYCVQQARKDSWFLHFNGNQEDMPLLRL